MNHVLIIDTSYSMTQKTSSKLSLLEIAKKFVETYIITRMRMIETKGDKYFIYTTDRENKKEISSYLMINDIQFILEHLRSITCSYHTDMFYSLKSVLEYLNFLRVVSGADNYFGGRDILKAENTNVIASHC